MTTITKTYTYPLPDDNFVKGVSGDRVGEWTYEGPDEFVVEVASDGEIYDVDTKVPGPDRVHVTINAETHPEIADCFAHYFTDDAGGPEMVFEDITMENGDVYQHLTNPRISDVYKPIWNRTTGTWKLTQILRPIENPAAAVAGTRRDRYQDYRDRYDFSEEINTLIDNYIAECNTFIDETPGICTWKYITVPTEQPGVTVPRMPAAVEVEFAKIELTAE